MIATDRQPTLPRVTHQTEPSGDPFIAEPVPDGSVDGGKTESGHRQAIPEPERQSLNPIVLEKIREALKGQAGGRLGDDRVAVLESRAGLGGGGVVYTGGSLPVATITVRAGLAGAETSRDPACNACTCVDTACICCSLSAGMRGIFKLD